VGWGAQLALTLPVYAWTGALFHRGALEAARHRTTNMDTLVSLGTTVAFGYSAIATIALPGRPTYYDVAALIITLIAVGKYLELAGRARAGAAIEALAELQPRTAHLMGRASTGHFISGVFGSALLFGRYLYHAVNAECIETDAKRDSRSIVIPHDGDFGEGMAL
jgi:cation transport ATPase